MQWIGSPARRGLLFLATLVLWTTAAAADPPARSAMLVLRGPQSAAASQPAPTSSVAPATVNRSIDPGLAASLSPDWSSSPRVGGYSAASTTSGGGQCKLSCAQDYYVCRAGQDDEDCGSHWSQCLSACPSWSAEAATSGY